MAFSQQFERRRFLRGAGACLALPLMESLVPSVQGVEVAARQAPLRAAFLAVPDGVNMERWRPKGVGLTYELNDTFAPLDSMRHMFQVFSGFAHRNAYAMQDGAGDHARANAVFLTGARPLKTAGANFRNGISVDQLAAQRIGHLTRIPSLQLGSEAGRSTGNCDSGYSCAYQLNLSWASPTMPLAPEPNPRAVFENLFGIGAPDQRQRNLRVRQQQRLSVLDFIAEDSRTISRRLGSNDRHKLDEYLTSVRSVEQQIDRSEQFTLAQTTMSCPDRIPEDHQTHLRVMFDLLVLAFQTDSTRLATFPLAHEGSNRSFPELGIDEGHHDLSHHKGQVENLEKIAKIDHFYVEQLAYFLQRLDAAKEPGGSSVLDNSMIVYGCAISDGHSHAHNDLPILLAGGGRGSLTPGRHVKVGEDVPMTNLYLSLLDRLGVEADRLGDSTGRLAGI
ncbi:MAG: DUF1552 domain-containing protein [Pirellulales bacterium]|nr:DUF1552 domain-containing protein [Pirellulales bacterium]